MADYQLFLPSYVGSKRSWVSRNELLQFKGRRFVELFAGSGVISASLASSAILNDLDPITAKILADFDLQIVPEVFTREMYYEVRGLEDWWKWAYCLQSVSFSGVFRYSKNGYNVPIKGGPSREGNMTNEWYLRPKYEASVARWGELAPAVFSRSYETWDISRLKNLGDPVVILDPPYEGSKASYNSGFDYDQYWEYVYGLVGKFDLVIFDRATNLEQKGFSISGERAMRVNGAYRGDVEAVSVSKLTP